MLRLWDNSQYIHRSYVSIFNGISQGVQPLISNSYGNNDKKQVKQLLKLTISLCLLVEIMIIASAWELPIF